MTAASVSPIAAASGGAGERRTSPAAFAAGIGVLVGAVGATVLSITLLAAARGTPLLEHDIGGTFAWEVASRLAFLPQAVMAALVIWRQPRNPIGAAMAALAFGFPLSDLGQGWAHWAIDVAHAPGGVWAAWVANWGWILTYSAVPVILLLFPTGRVLSPRWRWALRAALVNAVLFVLSAMLIEGPLSGYSGRDNPIGILPRGSRGTADLPASVAPFFAGVLTLVVVSALSLVQRYRRSTGDERLQIRWVTYGVTAFAVYMVGTQFLPNDLDNAVSLVVPNFIPVTVALGVFKYRLYEVDRVVSRTVTWALVTAVLAGVYVAVVTGVGAALPAGSSSYAAAIATLVAVGLLQPLRRRLQDVVDRRFNRSRYDAARTAAGFAARLRDEVAIDDVCRDLLATVASVLAPASATVILVAGESA